MENSSNINAILDQKLDSSRYSGMENFIAPQEITVTITLAEYRELVKNNATTQVRIDEANKNKWERDTENKKLKEEIAELKAKLYELQNKESLSKEDSNNV